MEQKPSSYDSVDDHLLGLPAQYPWLIAQNVGAEENVSTYHIFCSLHDPLFKYECQIPELTGKRIRGCYHGWVILSDHTSVMWSLWNPITSKMINFPPLILKDGDSKSIKECCLSAPPDGPNSVLLLTRSEKPTIVFFRLVSKRTKLRWIEMSYASQLMRITGEDGLFIYRLACCDGKVYALNTCGSFVTFLIQLDIVVKKKEVLINLLMFGTEPSWEKMNRTRCSDSTIFLKGYCSELFCITVGFIEGKPVGVYFYKLDTTSLKSEERERFRGLDMTGKDWYKEENCSILHKSHEMWEEMVELKDAVFFVDLSHDQLVYYKPAIASELGGYIHFRDEMGKILYSYHVKDNTIALSWLPLPVLPTSSVSLWECRLENDHREAKSKQKDDEIVARSVVTDGEVEYEELHLLNLPSDILETIMQHCVGVEYMNFRSTCKRFHLAAPMKKWRDESTLKRLRAYSLNSPWLMVLDKNQGIITFTDPILGDNYFIKNLHISVFYRSDCCLRFGWLLFSSTEFGCMVFFNPFTGDIRKLPNAGYYFCSVCFSAPPTSPDCMVVGFSTASHEWELEWVVLIHYVAREASWRAIRVGVDPRPIQFPTFFGQDLYALGDKGKLIRFKDLGEENCSAMFVEADARVSCCSTSPTQCYLTKCDGDLLKVIVGKYGEFTDVFKLNESKQEWEKIDSLGKHMIYICGSECVCIEAKTPQMENKIYFPILQSNNRKIVFYSLETCRYHTFNGANIQQHLEDFFGTTYHLSHHWWIEPSWS